MAGPDPQFSDDDSMNSTITYQGEGAASEGDQYVNYVKITLGGESEKFKEFYDLFKDFKQGRLSEAGAGERMKLLLSGHKELIEGFNRFLPTGYKIELPPPRRTEVSFEEAISFVNQVKKAFPQEPERYHSFLGILTKYRNSEISMQEVSQKTCEILWERQDLVQQFINFVPDLHKATYQQIKNNMGTSAQQK